MNAKELKNQLDTPTMHSLVGTYLLARAYAETMREAVDKIQDQIMQEIPVYADKTRINGRDGGRRILHVRDLYQTADDAICNRIYAECDKLTRAAGLKPASMEFDFCPALVAEDELRKVQRALVNAAGAPLGISADSLLCSAEGLENYKKFTDLTVGAIVRLPSFKKPKI